MREENPLVNDTQIRGKGQGKGGGGRETAGSRRQEAERALVELTRAGSSLDLAISADNEMIGQWVSLSKRPTG